MPQLAPHSGLTLFLYMSFMLVCYFMLVNKTLLPSKKTYFSTKQANIPILYY
uniref:ATP synthase F0 subunit 8 n=1 Tax=Rabdotus mooreanus TaxID=3014811 RepID=UPI00286AC6B8|nr:ATP synthase F0 subunit 8 [Rabdotus mooreanus]WLN31338.1 ATP synthase F0 subunit 8 [Rabdotus mooreanus]